MNAERLRQIEELYHAARERSPEERAALLAEVPLETRREVEALLARDVAESTETMLAVGSQLGPYKIEGLLGAGGMGQVYRAMDTRLGRRVAIKISAERFSGRFEREARAIAVLNHPNICTLHDVGPNYLVMELVEGETLAARLKKGALPIGQALEYGAQIAGALAAAHAKGITHRDLKPGNIMIAKSGVKVLDFGLAKSQQDDTVTASRMVVGTPAYMAPEQRDGKECDARTDIFSLGLVLSEMMTGRRGETQPLQNAPEKLAHIVERCLASDPDQRWQTAQDVKLELEWIARSPAAGPGAVPRKSPMRWIGAIAIIGLLVTAAWMLASRGMPQGDQTRSFRLSILPPPGAAFAMGPNREGPAVSLDGRTLAFIGIRHGQTSLWVQPFDSPTARELVGTEEAHFPFWSPDSRSIAFFTFDKLKRIDVSGGPARTLCDVSVGRGGDWSPDGATILYSPQPDSPLYRIPAGGGQPAQVTTLDTSRGENSHRHPQFLPDGRRFLYTVGSGRSESVGLYSGSLDDPKLKVQVTKTYSALYAPALGHVSGHLLWLREQTVVAQPWDAERLRFTGDPEPVFVLPAAYGQLANQVSVSRNVLVSESSGLKQMQAAWLNREGATLARAGEPDFYSFPNLSPDGRRVVLTRGGPLQPGEIWIVDLSRNISSRVSLGQGTYGTPVWSPDGNQIAFSVGRGGASVMAVTDASGTGSQHNLAQAGRSLQVTDWSRAGLLAHSMIQESPALRSELWFLPHGETKRQRIAGGGALNGQFSPDGKWVAYASPESGRLEIYVQAFPEGRQRWQVSGGGGNFPRWRRDGKELFYVGRAAQLMSVPVKTGAGALEFAPPHDLFPLPVVYAGAYSYDVSADGQRILAVALSAEAEREPLSVIVNWQAGLKR
jgi:Tol biopolymer transport system component